MAFNISEIDVDTKECELSYGDNVLHFKYRMSAYTPNHEDAVEEAVKANKVGTTLKAMLLPLLSSWDVVEDVPRVNKNGAPILKDGAPVIDSVPVPLTAEGLSRVPIRVLSDINRAIMDDVTPGEASSTSSEGSFS